MISIFIELYRDNDSSIFINVRNIETVYRVDFPVQGKAYTRIQMVSGEKFHTVESPKKILDLIEKAKIEERKENAICLT